jgi:hypothetical protein
MTMGMYSANTSRSFTATWIRVYAALPPTSRLHTNTMAVQGAVPSSTQPAMYSSAWLDVTTLE